MTHDRVEERAELAHRLGTGASILMLAPRRIGKTWLLNKIDEDMTARGWLCIRVDVEGKQTEEQFLGEICAAIERKQGLGKRLFAHMKQRFRQLAQDNDGGLQEAIGKIDSRGFLETLVESLNAEGAKTLILVDEIALFILARAQKDVISTSSLLYHLRKLQQTYRKVQWFLTGSVGLDIVTERHGMAGALLDYDSFTLSPFTSAAALSYIDHLCATQVVPRPFTFGDGAFAQLEAELGWLSPYYLRQIALLVKPSAPPALGAALPVATPADIARAAADLLSPLRKMHFAPWREHIEKNFERQETERLHAILDIASASETGEIEATYLTHLHDQGLKLTSRELKDAFNILGNDGYFVRDGDRWRFQSQLLRRYWLEFMKR